MKIIDRHNAEGAGIYVSVHVNDDTEVSIHSDFSDMDASRIKIGTVAIFASDVDLTIMASAIGDHIRSKYMGK